MAEMIADIYKVGPITYPKIFDATMAASLRRSDPDTAKSSKEFLHLLRVSSAMMLSIKNKVLDPVKRFSIFSIQLYR